MRTFVIGDIHGAYRALLHCLERSGFSKEEDTLIQLGDICDGWSEVKECVYELLSIKNLIVIKGNHDDWFNEYLKTGIHPTNWMYGGIATRDSFNVVSNTIEDFFNSQHLYYVDDNNRLFVHGGIQARTSVDYIKKHNPSEFYWNRSMWNEALSLEADKKLETLDNFSEIFIGHTTTMNWGTDKPMYSGGVWNLDTGAGFKGRLTIMNVDTKEYWQSDRVEELYPNDRGRN